MKRLKRLLDVVAAGAILIPAAPLLALLAAAIRALMGPPAIFRQQRAGLGGRVFTLLKFRTMTHERDARGELLPDDRRLTPLGRFLRAASLDELPQLWNVLRGDMSLVGPRPLLARYLGRYSPRQSRRHAVRPGITGWAQVRGRNALSWEERFELDVWYVDNWSLALDAKTLLMTGAALFDRRGAAATSPEFRAETAR